MAAPASTKDGGETFGAPGASKSVQRTEGTTKRRQLLASLAAWPLAAAAAGRTWAAGPPGSSGRRSIAQMQQDWRQFLAQGADVTQSTAPLTKSEAEWKSALAQPQFQVLRKEGTERPFSSPLNDEKRPGVFVCAGCSLPHFTSEMKF